MNIRFVSSLTAEDENQIAPIFLAGLTAILDLLAFPYVLRIDTSDSKVYEHTRPGLARQEEPTVRRAVVRSS